MGRYLPVLEVADGLHQLGLQQELSGHYPEAQATFTQAVVMLMEADGSDAAVVVQRARVVRDEGFNLGRWALAGNNLEGLDEAGQRLNQSLLLTTPFISGMQQPFVGEVKNFASKRQRREIFDEHAATLGLCARLVVAGQVLREEITPERVAPASIRSKQFQNGTAYDLAKFATNQYYATSIAMNGARMEVVNGRPLNAAVWCARAGVSLGRAQVRDRGNFIPTAKTMERIRREITDRETAMQATINPNTV